MSLFSPFEAFQSATPVMSSEQQLAHMFGGQRLQMAETWSLAVQACLLASGVDSDHEVILPALAPASLAQAVCMVGAVPVFVDVESDSLLASQRAIERAITDQTKAVLVCHLYGQIFDGADLYAQLRSHNIALIEDGSDAFLSLAATSANKLPSSQLPGQNCDFLITCPPQAREAEANWPSFIFSRHEESMDRLARWARRGADDQWVDLHLDSSAMVGLIDKPNGDLEPRLSCFLDQVEGCQRRLQQQISRYQTAFRQAPLRLLKPRTVGLGGQAAMPVHVPPSLRDECFDSLRKAGFGVFRTYRSLPDLAYFKPFSDSSLCPNARRWTNGAFSLPTGSFVTSREQALLIKQMNEHLFSKILDQLFR